MASEDVVFVTGANTGLGLEIVRALCRSEKPYQIILGSRDIEKGKNALNTVRKEHPDLAGTSIDIVQIDTCSDTSVKEAFNVISRKYSRLDVLVNNVGAGFDMDVQTGTRSIREAWNMAWDVNVTGTQVVTTQFVPLLLHSSNPRILFMTSGTSPLSETETSTYARSSFLNASPPAGFPKEPQNLPLSSYRSAKAGLNMMMREWHRVLLNDGVKVWAVSPGFLATGLGGVGTEKLQKMGAKKPSEGAEFVRDVIEGTRDEHRGKAIRSDGIQPW